VEQVDLPMIFHRRVKASRTVQQSFYYLFIITLLTGQGWS
jgi:hypothetical protein